MAVKRSIVERLTSQLEAKGMPEGKAHHVAVTTLQRAGVLRPGTETLTPKGEERQAMGAAGRAKDRAATESGGKRSPDDYVYNQLTNRARLRGK